MTTNQASESIPWKKRLYDAYVSSGQAGGTAPTAETAFLPRKAYITHLISGHFPSSRSARILDIGCGHGAFLYFLAAAGYTNVTGIDTSPEQINLAAKLGIDNAHCAQAFEYISSLAPDSLDVVILFDILEHLERQELFDLLDEIRRILRPGGMCLVHVPNGEGLFGMRILCGDLTHIQAFTQASARQLFTTIGFSRIEYHEDRPIPHGLASTVRRLLWDIGTIPFRILQAAEIGVTKSILSQNMLIKVYN
ncbi:MAG TPA: class I SAM-dependent methyltransferase [Acidobacteriaceae bacterium]|jgi:SAM-dependent methyltransferase|nr:class I SAM-dependent methyltransferase [Acidobacteriaceae bacterium]